MSLIITINITIINIIIIIVIFSRTLSLQLFQLLPKLLNFLLFLSRQTFKTVNLLHQILVILLPTSKLDNNLLYIFDPSLTLDLLITQLTLLIIPHRFVHFHLQKQL